MQNKSFLFAPITNIDEVLPIVEEREEFFVSDKTDYKVINYTHSTENTFNDENFLHQQILRECRGLLFDKKGNVLSRRYHKFFNLNEKEETQTQNLDFTLPHIVLEKLDGSMISPIFLDDKIFWTTKMGITDVAVQVQLYANQHPEYEEFARDILRSGFTPIFEWCSRKQRIVIDYPKDELILTAIRSNNFGYYIPYSYMVEKASQSKIPVVKAFQSTIDDISKFVDMLRPNKEIEGVVVRFDNGTMIKIKTDQYLKIHRAKEEVQNERKLLSAIFENSLDDIIGVFPEDLREKIVDYEISFEKAFSERVNTLSQYYNNMEWTRKEFALNTKNMDSSLFKTMIFSMFNGGNPKEIVANTIKKSLGNTKKFQDMKRQFFPDLKYEGFESE